MSEQREYAVCNPYSGGVMTVPDNSLANAQKMVALVPDSVVMTRTVTEWVEYDGEPQCCPQLLLRVYKGISDETMAAHLADCDECKQIRAEG